MRYLRPQRREGFISLIAVFSFLGIMLGVAILIIVMSVMNGFRHELLGRIIGLNGHLTLQSIQGPLPDYEVLTKAIKSLPMVKAADPDDPGPGHGHQGHPCLWRRRARHPSGGSEGEDDPLREHPAGQPRQIQGPRCRHHRLSPGPEPRRHRRAGDHPDLAPGARHGRGLHPAHQELHRRRHIRRRHVRVRQRLCLHAAGGRAALLHAAAAGEPDRDLRRRPRPHRRRRRRDSGAHRRSAIASPTGRRPMPASSAPSRSRAMSCS